MRVNAPKGVLTESLRAQIAERKQELLDYLHDNSAPAALSSPPIVRRMHADPTPLSFAQERIWFLEQLEPGSAVYNVCRAWRLLGKLNVSAIQSSLNEIVRRHHVLRSSIRVDGSRPVQVVGPRFELDLSVTNIEAVSLVGRETQIGRKIQQVAEAPFDFAAGKFLRAELLCVADNEHVLILATHHIVSDAWSMGMLTRELWLLYEAYASGISSQLEEPQIQYSDFAAWQRDWLQGAVLEGQVCYWKEQLKDLTHLNLPTDRPRPARQSLEAAKVAISLPETLTTAIHDLSNQAAVTPFMILLAAFQVLLYRYCGQEQIVVGSPIANRVRTELEPLIGFFVNTLVLRSYLSGNSSFKELLGRVREVCLGAYAHQDLPFEKLVQELQPERDLSRNPLFQVMFALQNATRPFSGNPGLQIEPIEIEISRSPFDLSVFLRERNGMYVGHFEYSTDLFNRDRIERMATHYRTLLEAIVADPDQPIAALSILTEAERQKIVIEWNDTAADYPRDSCIQELFEAQAERTPEAAAVQFEGKQLTYRELNSRANQLAHYFQGLGIGPKKLVGICVERSLEMVVGLLGILKAGGAYVPLDPAYPRERLAFMLQDAQVSVLLTQEKLVEDRGWKLDDSNSRSPVLGPQLICLDRDWEKIAHEGEENLEKTATAQDLAYVIYTSGSTGKPKGVQIEHRSVLNCLHSVRQAVELTKNDVFLALTTISFDIATLELCLPLAAGAKLVLGSQDEVLDAKLLLNRLKECGATVMQATPSGWKLLLDTGWRSSRNFKILCGGEILSRELAQRLLECGILWNLYGPTETTIWSTMCRVEPGDELVYIGRPLANTQIYVLDGRMQPVPIGVHGDLYIGGDGLARGYLNSPVLTSERFVCNPFSDDPSARLYRTGDRAVFRAGGNIEFLGRTDDQIKIRGCRIELGEIETVLNKHPAVKDAVVIVRERAASEGKSLVGYVVPRRQTLSLIPDLQSFLKRMVPHYMVPSLFVIVEALPRNANGKIDRRRLPQPDDTRLQLPQESVEPRTEIEDLIDQVWREVLTLGKIGIHDNFFKIGGHSLSALAIISRLTNVFEKDISLFDFLNKPTIAGLANVIEGVLRRRRKAELPPIVRVSRDQDFPLSISQKQLWLLNQLFPGTYFQNVPYGYHLTGALDTEALQKSLQEIVRRHEAFHLVFEERRGRPLQVVGKVPKVILKMTDLRDFHDEEGRKRQFLKLSTDDASLPFDLERGPLVRGQLVTLAEREHILLVTVHHIISDDWSMQIFRRELMTLYESFVKGQPSPLPEPRIQFVDFVLWQKNAMRSRLFKAQVGYWKNHLRVRANGLGFVSHRKVHKAWGFASATMPIEIDPAVVLEMKDFANRENCTVFMILFAVLTLLLHIRTGQTDIRVGTTVANRRHRETEDLIGNCLNAIVLRSQIDSNSSFRQFLKRIRQVCIEALTNQDVPFGHVARVLGRNPKSKRHSQTEVMFIYQKRNFEALTVSGTTFAPWGGNYRRLDQDVLLTGAGLIVELRDASTKLTGAVTYKTGPFDKALALEIASNFEKLLSVIIHNADELVKRGLELLPIRSRHQRR